MWSDTVSVVNALKRAFQTIQWNDVNLQATLFILIVVIWYAISIVCLMGMQIKKSDCIVEDQIEYSAKLFVQYSRDQTNSKTILKELVDKQKRDKLWDIYLGKSGEMNNRITRDDKIRIRNIEKQLSIIDRSNENISSSLSNYEFTDNSNTDLNLSFTSVRYS